MGFILLLAFACLRWSDLQRSAACTLSADAIYAETWRSKKKVGKTPWAAPRRDWQGRDWGGPLWATISMYVDLHTADFVVPAVLFRLGAFVVLQPVRPMSYS
eukprot:1890014-Pyramimonas_sp.AAC.1